MHTTSVELLQLPAGRPSMPKRNDSLDAQPRMSIDTFRVSGYDVQAAGTVWEFALGFGNGGAITLAGGSAWI